MDVIVVGGGIIGLFSAYYLAKRGFNVSIVDAGYVKASRFNAGFVVPSFALIAKFTLFDALKALLGWGPVKVSLFEPGLAWLLKAYRGAGFLGLGAVRELGFRSLELYREFFSGERLEVDIMKGVLALFLERRSAEEFSMKVKGKLVDRRELQDMGYKGFEAGLLVEEEAALDPEKLYDSMTRLLKDRGVKFIDDKVLGVGEDKRVKLSLAKAGVLKTDYAVIACGSWTSELTKPLGYDPAIIPARGLMAKLRLKEKILEKPGLMEDYGVAVQQHPSTNTLRFTGFFELLGFNESWSKGRVEWLLDKVRKHVVRIEEIKLEEVELSTGFRPCTPTMTPVIGFIAESKKIVVASGHCRLGLTLAPATGELVADLIEGVKPKLSQEAVKELTQKI